MTGPSHIVVGFGTAVALARFAGIQPNALELFILIVGALAPDIDGGGTITAPGRIFRVFIPRVIGDALDAIVGFLSRVVGGMFGHRGFFHWPALSIAMFCIAASIHSPLLMWFAVGYLSHILADFLTVGGVPLLAPFWRKKVSARFMVTGSPTEAIVSGALLVFICGFGFELLPDSLQEGLAEFKRYLDRPR